MPTIIDHINKIINPKVKIEVTTHINGGQIILKEDEPQAKLKQVTLRGFDVKHTFAFKLDIKSKRLSHYLNPSTAKINKGCDGIIFTYLNKTWYALICELKSRKPDEEEYCSQFRNSAVFLKFIKLILEEYYQNNDDFEIKYILFDKKKREERTPTKGPKIEPEATRSNGKTLYIYRVHHLHQDDFFNIQHLKL